jgi:hypothetical protein
LPTDSDRDAFLEPIAISAPSATSTGQPATGESPTGRRPGPESTLAQVREDLIEAALVQLLDSGVVIGLTPITLSAAIEATNSARATAYRSLADPARSPQDKLRLEALLRLLARRSRDENHERVSNAVGHLFEQQRALYHSADIADRTRLLRAMIRVGAGTSYRSVAASTERAILIAAYGASKSQGTHVDPAQLEQLTRGEQTVSEHFGDLYQAFADLFGYRLKPPFTIDQFATVVASLVEGMAMRSHVSEVLQPLYLATDEDGATEDWELFGIAFEGLFTTFWEPVSTSDPFADLLRYSPLSAAGEDR